MSDDNFLRSGVRRTYRKAFVVEEDTLRRVQGVMEKAGHELEGQETYTVFRVGREDDRFYETRDIAQVLCDPNIPSKRIISLSVELCENVQRAGMESPYRDVLAEVDFKAEEKFGPFRETNQLQFRISSTNRNWALLLADNLEPQIERTFRAKGWPRTALLFIMLIPLLLLWGRFLPDPLPQGLAVPLTGFLVGGGILAVFLEMLVRPRWVTRWLGPESVFLWGEEAERYEERKRIRRNVFWGIIVAFIVSCLASLVVASGLSRTPAGPAATSADSVQAAPNAPVSD